uniref:Uncharacterized protein n=1 Tax=Heterorhabditis bacteriophora TaxID=37862 RepID=A0A1I7WJB6_HETBA
MLLTITSLDTLSDAMRKAGLESTNIIFEISINEIINIILEVCNHF